MIIYYLEMSWVLCKAKVKVSKGKSLRWESKASGNQHKPPMRLLSYENEKGFHRKGSKHLKSKKPCIFKILLITPLISLFQCCFREILVLCHVRFPSFALPQWLLSYESFFLITISCKKIKLVSRKLQMTSLVYIKTDFFFTALLFTLTELCLPLC